MKTISISNDISKLVIKEYKKIISNAFKCHFSTIDAGTFTMSEALALLLGVVP